MQYILPNMSFLIPGISTVKKAANNLINTSFANETAKYFDEDKIVESSPQSYDENLAKELWNLSVELTGVDLK